jgi:hypothetical protein
MWARTCIGAAGGATRGLVETGAAAQERQAGGRGDTRRRSPKAKFLCRLASVSDTELQRGEQGTHLVGREENGERVILEPGASGHAASFVYRFREE